MAYDLYAGGRPTRPRTCSVPSSLRARSDIATGLCRSDGYSRSEPGTIRPSCSPGTWQSSTRTRTSPIAATPPSSACRSAEPRPRHIKVIMTDWNVVDTSCGDISEVIARYEASAIGHYNISVTVTCYEVLAIVITTYPLPQHVVDAAPTSAATYRLSNTTLPSYLLFCLVRLRAYWFGSKTIWIILHTIVACHRTTSAITV